jgi:hypothetical protein
MVSKTKGPKSAAANIKVVLSKVEHFYYISLLCLPWLLLFQVFGKNL